MSTVLVTGGSGFVGSHIILQLLAAGLTVRTTVRSLQREAGVRAMLESAGAKPGDRLSFFAADLERDEGWAAAVAGCDYVMHVASPMPAEEPKHEDEVIVPARDGVLRVLRAARDAKVKRVVLTSTCGAIYYGHPLRKEPFDETSWTNIQGEMSAYVKSKAIAERAAWDFIAAEGGGLEFTSINPSGIFGPALGADYSSSLELVKRLMNRMPGCPQLYFGVVDVRDVADLHLRAMTSPAAKGERFIAVSGECMSMMDIAAVLKARLGDAAKKVPTRPLPDWLVRLGALFNPGMKQLLPLLGKIRNASSDKARRVLGWEPRSREDAVVATAESLLKLGLIGAGVRS
ncbi:SDR family oxidoreductase [Archangium violaceum]|uniref:SDR family oxidoreductase n=1 Tax=Archangium violaceum TaxID=83451 RepID=UPI0036D777EA